MSVTLFFLRTEIKIYTVVEKSLNQEQNKQQNPDKQNMTKPWQIPIYQHIVENKILCISFKILRNTNKAFKLIIFRIFKKQILHNIVSAITGMIFKIREVV